MNRIATSLKASFLIALALVIALAPNALAAAAPVTKPPNILFLLADDLGYGDVKCFNPQGRIPTPNIDQLASRGMRFTDAHAPGAVCFPSRYGLLTGRYPFRHTNLDPTKGPLIEPGRVTLASLLHAHGYATAMIGKWHLGFEGGDRFDFSRPLRGGPFDHGFDYFFGQHASLDIPPYFYIENDHAVAAPTGEVAARCTPDWSPIQAAFWRAGAIAPNFKHEDVLPTYTHKAVEYIERRRRAADGKPFFLYVAFTAPHTPWLPSEAFRAKSAGGLYGDWVAQFDDAVGRVLAALDRSGLAENTLVFFTSDNGPVWYPQDVKEFGHCATGVFRGMKGDAWEGGHRMPFVARWPGRILPGSTSAQTICFTDMLATFAALVGARLPANAGEDSLDLTPLLVGRQRETAVRDSLVVGWTKGGLSVRQGDWKLIPFLGSGGFSKPTRIKPKPGQPIGQLYNLAEDPSETRNLYAAKPAIVARLSALLEKTTTTERSAPR